jgi:hypothetical protein
VGQGIFRPWLASANASSGVTTADGFASSATTRAPVRGAFGPLQELIDCQERKHGGEQAALLGDPCDRLNLERVQREQEATHDRSPGLCGEPPQEPHNEQ